MPKSLLSEKINILQTQKHGYLIHTKSHETFKDTVLRVTQSLHVDFLKITLTVPLISFKLFRD